MHGNLELSAHSSTQHKQIDSGQTRSTHGIDPHTEVSKATSDSPAADVRDRVTEHRETAIFPSPTAAETALRASAVAHCSHRF